MAAALAPAVSLAATIEGGASGAGCALGAEGAGIRGVTATGTSGAVGVIASTLCAGAGVCGGATSATEAAADAGAPIEAAVPVTVIPAGFSTGAGVTTTAASLTASVAGSGVGALAISDALSSSSSVRAWRLVSPLEP